MRIQRVIILLLLPFICSAQSQMYRDAYRYLTDNPSYIEDNPAILSTTQGIYADVSVIENQFTWLVAIPLVNDWRFAATVIAREGRWSYNNMYGYADEYSQYRPKGYMGFHLSNMWRSPLTGVDSLVVGVSTLNATNTSFLSEVRTTLGVLIYAHNTPGSWPLVLGAAIASEPDVEDRLDIDMKLSHPSTTLSLVGAYSIMGDDREFRYLEYPLLRGVRRLGIMIHPTPWLTFGYSRLVEGESEYRLGVSTIQKGYLSAVGLELYGVHGAGKNTWSKGQVIGLNVHMGFMGGMCQGSDTVRSLGDTYYPTFRPDSLTSKLSNTQRVQKLLYHQQKIGVTRGAVLPVLATFSGVGTFLLPLGTNNFIVGNHATGLKFLTAQVGAGLFIYYTQRTFSRVGGDVGWISAGLTTFFALKVWDFLIASEYVREHNEGLKIKLKMAPTEKVDGVTVGVSVEF
ncbi:MAG: hypothetical protein OCC49_19375 [Fibrobacterales bacterium]